jgi:hypothetical protein
MESIRWGQSRLVSENKSIVLYNIFIENKFLSTNIICHPKITMSIILSNENSEYYELS